MAQALHKRWLNALIQPFVDVYGGLDRCLNAGWVGLAKVTAGLLVGWWIYVPLHELLHAFGCWVTGGRVGRLEIAELYLGALWAQLFDFVEAGGEYAGRLADFDTGGSDLVYLATDLAPFVMTLWPGVWALRWAASGGRAWLFGGALPFALAPFLSLTGDAYEIGSILTTRLQPWQDTAAVLRGDDLFKVGGGLVGAGFGVWSGFALATLLGVVWAWTTWSLGAALATSLGRPALGQPAPARAQEVI